MAVPAKAKLSEEQVKKIRRRVRAGEHQTELAAEYGVDRKTIRRRVDAADQADRERAQRRAGADSRPSSQPSAQTSTATGLGGVPIFPNTRKGLLERLAYYEAHKLNNLPNSLLDYHDVLHGRETPDERRARHT